VTIKGYSMGDLDKVDAADERVNSPNHYTHGGIEVIDYLEAKLTREEFIGYLRGNVIKYISRLGLKDESSEQAKKAEWYCRRLAATLQKK